MRRILEQVRLLSARDALGLMPAALLSGALLILAALQAQNLLQPADPYRGPVWTWAGYGAAVSLGAWPAFRWILGRIRVSILPDLREYVLSLQWGALLLVIPVWLLAWRSPLHDVEWRMYGFEDKQWLFFLYWLGLGAVLFLPHFLNWLLRRPRTPEPVVATPRGPGRGIAARLLLSVSLACLFAGPPWNLHRHHRGIDYHEQIHLGPLQAIDKGHLPAVGAASTQYGPGSQLLTYLSMKASGRFDMVGYREAGAWFHFLSTLIVLCVAAATLEGWALVSIVALGLVHTPLSLFQFGEDGTLGGYYGWGNGLRYMGALLVTVALPRVSASGAGRLPIPLSAVALGLVWGLFAWIAQENLASTMASGTLLLSLLWLTRTRTGGQVMRAAAGLAAGFAVFWTPVLAFYALHGKLGEFLRCYFLVPGAVVNGYSNTYLPDTQRSEGWRPFYLTPLIILAAGFFALCDVRRAAPRMGLDARQTLALAYVSSLAACFAASLFRTDLVHVTNTLIALPFVVHIAIRDVPLWVSGRPARQWMLRAGIAALVVAAYPGLSSWFEDHAGMARRPFQRFFARGGPEPTLPDPRAPFVRATPLLADEPAIWSGSLPMREFLEDAAELRSLLGERRTHVRTYPRVYPGLVYFMADLTPAPHLLDRFMLLITRDLEREQEAFFDRHAGEIEALIAEDLVLPEVGSFERAHPGSVRIRRVSGGFPYYVLLAPSALR